MVSGNDICTAEVAVGLLYRVDPASLWALTRMNPLVLTSTDPAAIADPLGAKGVCSPKRTHPSSQQAVAYSRLRRLGPSILMV